jgi:acyl-coenzyme A thioesterase PaaI-like protein
LTDFIERRPPYLELQRCEIGTTTVREWFQKMPAAGERILARGRVVKAGRTLTVAQTEVFAKTGGEEKLIALLTATFMTVKERDGISD